MITAADLRHLLAAWGSRKNSNRVNEGDPAWQRKSKLASLGQVLLVIFTMQPSKDGCIMQKWLLSPARIMQKSSPKKRAFPKGYLDYREMLKDKKIDVIDIGIPNDLHCQVTVDAAKAGKHVIIEKPLCLSLEEADQMIEACQKAGVLLMYAEELLFAPKYVRVKN